MTNQTGSVCPSCGNKISENSGPIILGDKRKGLSGNWQLVVCNHCGVISMSPMPTTEQLAVYYGAYSKDNKVDLTRRIGAHYPKLRKLFHLLSGDVDPRDFVEVPSGARVLDYGCGQASYLCDFHDQGIAISGAEIAEHLVDACKKNGLDVHKVDDFSQIPFEDETFDIVYLMQVFEHLHDPHTSLKELFRILKNGGILYLALPNTSSIWRKVFQKNWVSGWFVPFHLFLYNHNSLAKIAGEHGFQVLQSWSNTPEAWFRLNLKASLYPKENQLEWHPTWLDTLPMRYILMALLRIIELPFHERDCLVMKLQKKG
jgi:SAM-dependent methyltransferase